MLKVTITDTPSERRITLSGKLIGPWIQELRRVWEQCRSQAPARKIVCDLNNVIQIDESANSLLNEMMAEGTELVSDGELEWLADSGAEGRQESCLDQGCPSQIRYWLQCRREATPRDNRGRRHGFGGGRARTSLE